MFQQIFIRATCIIFLFQLGFSAFGETLIINEKDGSYKLAMHTLVLQDSAKEYTINDILTPKLKRSFIPNHKENLYLGHTESGYWLRFRIKNNDKAGTFIIKINNASIDRLDFYKVGNNFGFDIIQAGDQVSFEKRVVAHRYPIFPIHLDSLQESTYFMYVESEGGNINMPLYLWKPVAHGVEDYRDQWILGFYYGILFIVFLLNLFLYVTLRWRPYIFYVLFIVCLVAFQMAVDGIGFQYIWTNQFWWANHVISLAGPLSMLFAILFAQYFLATKENNPRIHRALIYLALIAVLLAALSTLGNPFFAMALSMIKYYVLLVNLILIVAAVVAIRRSFQSYIYFLIGFSMLILGVTLYVLYHDFNLLPRMLITTYAIHLGSAIEVIVLTFALVTRFRKIREAKIEAQAEAVRLLEEQALLRDKVNRELEERVKERTKEVQLQKKELEVKNIDITDSIRYARHIQEAILPPDSLIRERLANYFLVFLPRDIVSGDFYWVHQIGDEVLFALVDCTGHGVPGAFMSIVGHNQLNHIVDFYQITEPAKILDELNTAINETLRQTYDESSVRDGMDLSLCCLNLKTRTLQFSGAHNPLYIVRKGISQDEQFKKEMYTMFGDNLVEIPADRAAVGGFLGEKIKPFTNHEFTLHEGDTIYLFSDGVVDQFGGRRGRKFKHKRLKSLLLTLINEPLEAHHKHISTAIKNWMKDEPQIDDISLLGYRIKSDDFKGTSNNS